MHTEIHRFLLPWGVFVWTTLRGRTLHIVKPTEEQEADLREQHGDEVFEAVVSAVVRDAEENARRPRLRLVS